MRVLAWVVRLIGDLNRLIGNIFSWLALAAVLVCFTVVAERYLFSTTRLWMQDLYVWLSGAMFTAVAGFAFFRGDHVRVDIFYRPASVKWKATADLLGVLFLLFPFMYVVISYGLPYVQRSWRLAEASSNIGGMPGLYILKTFILVFAVLVTLQGIAFLCRSILVLANREHLLPPLYRYEL